MRIVLDKIKRVLSCGSGNIAAFSDPSAFQKRVSVNFQSLTFYEVLKALGSLSGNRILIEEIPFEPYENDEEKFSIDLNSTDAKAIKGFVLRISGVDLPIPEDSKVEINIKSSKMVLKELISTIKSASHLE